MEEGPGLGDLVAEDDKTGVRLGASVPITTPAEMHPCVWHICPHHYTCRSASLRGAHFSLSFVVVSSYTS